MNKNNKGFTLIELLVVIAIIGLLASMIMVGLSSSRTKGRDARRIADLKEVQNGLEIYYMKSGSYPTNITKWADFVTALKSVGITQVPNDPTNPTNDTTKTYYYSYYSTTDGQHYVLGAVLEDKNNSILDNDIDDSVFNGMILTNCGTGGAGSDAVYCVGM